MNKQAIEWEARKLQIDIWKWRESVLTSVPELIDMLGPSNAARFLGVSYDELPDLGRFGDGQTRFEVAGTLDRQNKQILISQKFPRDQRRFTAAHEIGHLILHPDDVVLHRDRPIPGLTEAFYKKPPKERAADYFAACYLVPKKLLMRLLVDNFKSSLPFKFDNYSSFFLQMIQAPYF